MTVTSDPTCPHGTPNQAADRPRVSVVLATYNRCEYLAEAIDSLLNQSCPIDELIVVNDASTDDTAQLLDAYGDRLRVIHRTRNQGKPAALNLAIPQVDGDYVWLFDDDDIALPDALVAHQTFLAANPDIDFTYSDKYRVPGDVDIFDRDAWQLAMMSQTPPEAFFMRTLLSMNTLMQGMLIPVRCLAAVGPFDESLDRCEDHDMILRLAARFRGAGLGRATFVYREHAGTRGAGTKGHAAHERFRVLAQYRREVFRKAHARFELTQYLTHVPEASVADTSAGLEPAALIQRGCVMLRHGVVDLALKDFDAGFAHRRFDEVRQTWLSETLGTALDSDLSAVEDRTRLMRELHLTLRRHRQTAQVRHLARGLYWHLRRALAKRERPALTRAGANTAAFAGGWLYANLYRNHARP
ncbi:glycosyltransferase [Salinisphaera sp. T31B1]|uniref:glycosyltransferase family 2 protein n=1 Tax=Salinisphaera sp. T31B1 TaxID=727963 RepID=UPI0033425EAC